MKLRKLAIALGLIGMLGCDIKNRIPPTTTQVEGYNVSVEINKIGRKIMIEPRKQPGILIGPGMYAIDFDNDGRFDEIYLRDLPKGHVLEQKANLAELEKMYQKALEQVGEGK